MHDVVEKVLVSEEDIVKRSMELGKQISDDYQSPSEILKLSRIWTVQ